MKRKKDDSMVLEMIKKEKPQAKQELESSGLENMAERLIWK